MAYKLCLTLLISISLSMANDMWYINTPYGIMFPYSSLSMAENNENQTPYQIENDSPYLSARNEDISLPFIDMLEDKEKHSSFKKTNAGKKIQNKNRQKIASLKRNTQSNLEPKYHPKNNLAPNAQQAMFLAPNDQQAMFLAPMEQEARYLAPEFQSRFLIPRFVNPMSVIKKTFQDLEPVMTAEDKKNRTCIAKGGTLFDGDCYQYVAQPLEFEEAREFCMMNDGDLWTPNFNDGYLFNKLVNNMPDVLGSENKKVWIGVTYPDDDVFVDVQNNDISSTYFARVNFIFIPYECVVYSWFFGYQIAGVDECDDTNPFICEYPIKEMEDDQQQQHMFNKFNLNLFKKWH